MVKFGSLKYSSINIGDEIQSIAAWRFLPRVDYYVARDYMKQFDSGGEKVKVILNAWYTWRPDNFPPAECIEPLLVSMHLSEGCRDRLMTPRMREWLVTHGPVGCRDISTERYLEGAGVPAYFSGCLTTTLVPNPDLKRSAGGYVLCVDLPGDVVAAVRERADRPVYEMSKWLTTYVGVLDRFVLAKSVLYAYHNAHCVVTSNMHTALPCLAFGTPVCLVAPDDESMGWRSRFEGMVDWLNHCNRDEFLRGDAYDLVRPPANPQAHLRKRDKLVRSCSAFTGYDSGVPTLEEGFDPLLELLRILAASPEKARKTALLMPSVDLVSAMVKKLDRNYRNM